jgi:hypothetical protein
LSWNRNLRCDVCGRFIPVQDFIDEKAERRLIYPDAEGTREAWETLCKEHREKKP